MMKIWDNLGIMIMTYLVGYIRVNTVGFFAFHITFSLVSLMATALAYHYYLKKERQYLDKLEKLAKDAESGDAPLKNASTHSTKKDLELVSVNSNSSISTVSNRMNNTLSGTSGI
jgi:hypothetical protein